MRAPSRLKPEIKEQLTSSSSPDSHHVPRRKQSQNKALFFSLYLKHLPLFILSLGWYAGALFILLNVHPQEIQHTPFTHAYGPLQLTLFFGHFFLFSFLLLNTRRGFLVSVALGSLLFLKLQLVELNLILVSSVILTLFFSELALLWVTKRLNS